MLAFRAECFGGACPSNGSLKVGAPDVQSKSFASEGDTRSWAFPPNCIARCQGELYGEGMPQPFLPVSIWVFSHLPNV